MVKSMKNASFEEVKQDFMGAADLIPNEDMARLTKELVESPAQMLELQKQLMLLSFFFYWAGRMKECEEVKTVCILVSVVNVIRKRKGKITS